MDLANEMLNLLFYVSIDYFEKWVLTSITFLILNLWLALLYGELFAVKKITFS